jgi:CBS domain-containing protein
MLDEAAYTAGDLMTRDVAVVHPDTSLLEALKLMAQRRISGMPVVDDSGAIVGMVTEGDLIRWYEGMSSEGIENAPFLKEIQEHPRKIESVMSPGATTVPEDMLAREIAQLMYAKKIKRVPVLRDDKLIGIVARSDLVRALAQKLDEKPAPKIELGTLDEALRHAREEVVHRATTTHR